GAANAWTGLAADAERDLVFIPTGSASPDYYGALRLGDNRYANSIVALRASTGRVVWAFQTIHHDLWDYDNASPPSLATITRARRALGNSGQQERLFAGAGARAGPPGLPHGRPARARQRHSRRGGVADAALHDRRRAAQPASFFCGRCVGRVGRGSGGLPRGN